MSLTPSGDEYYRIRGTRIIVVLRLRTLPRLNRKENLSARLFFPLNGFEERKGAIWRWRLEAWGYSTW